MSPTLTKAISTTSQKDVLSPITATPVKKYPTTPASGSKTNTPSNSAASRLLYRGAISLPDSLLLLDGLTFSARLNPSPLRDAHLNPNLSASKHKQVMDLLENPLALALESMRGRPSLRFIGTVQLRDVAMDVSGDVELDIHPMAILSRVYFENMFCLTPYSNGSSSSSMDGAPLRSDVGLKVALGDSDGPETTEIVIFAQQVASAESRNVRMAVARLVERPPSVQPTKRLPRPDDPIPRKPPVFFRDQLKRTASTGARDLKRTTSTSGLAPTTKRVKLTEGSTIATTATRKQAFKVPDLPGPKQPAGNASASAKSKGKGKDKDVFGDVREVHDTKGKQTEEGQVLTVDENTLEKANKNVIKRATIEYLGRTKDPTEKVIDKNHVDFKELYNHIYRGVCFALRAKLRTGTLDLRLVDRLVDTHALMYLGGCGGSAQIMWGGLS